jgi:hypothetical protein
MPMAVFALLAVNIVMAGAANTVAMKSATARQKKAMFAGGCFWCMEKPFERLDRVLSVTSGYAGTRTPNPDYGNAAP